MFQNSLRLPREAEIRRLKTPSQGIEYDSVMSSSSSPFPVGFFMLRLHLRTNFTTDVSRITYVLIVSVKNSFSTT